MILSDITILASTILFFAVTIILVVVLLIAKISCPIRQCENHDKRQNGC